MNLVLLGPPGVGKGTQGARLACHYDIPAISTGAMFRDAILHGTDLGHTIQQYRIERGEYVPDDIVIDAVQKRLSEPDCANGFLMDGFPRTIPQADSLEHMLQIQQRRLTGVINFAAPLETIVKRFSGRRVCPNDGSTYHVETQPPLHAGRCDLCHGPLLTRPDDSPDVVKRRLEVYLEKTEPLITYYGKNNQLYTINADGTTDDIFQRVIGKMGSLK